MNNKRPVASKVIKSVLSLNSTLPLQASLPHLTKYKQTTSPSPIYGTDDDVASILDLLKQKCSIPANPTPENTKWKPTIFYPANTPVPTFQNPVIKLNTAFQKVAEWVHKYSAEAINNVDDDELNNANSDDEVIN